MRWIRAVCLAMSTYSRIPMPALPWGDSAMRVAISFMPLVGAVLGAALWLWSLIGTAVNISAILFSAAAVWLPVLITGGIHVDGYMDTMDALSSWKDREKMLEILKDPHVGAFAVMRCILHMLLLFGLYSELFRRELILPACFVFVLSRALAGLSAVFLPNARKTGMLTLFTKNVERRAVSAVLILWALASLAGLALTAPLHGVLCPAACALAFFWYRVTVTKRFGGVTGDTTGFYLQITEITLFAGILAGGLLEKVI